MSKKIEIRFRQGSAGVLHIRAAALRSVFSLENEEAQRDALWRLFGETRQALAGDNFRDQVNDLVWLRAIAEWRPKDKGVRPRERVLWAKLAERLALADDKREGAFTLSDEQARLLRDRLENPEFEFSVSDAALDSFLLYITEALGARFDDFEKHKDEYLYEDEVMNVDGPASDGSVTSYK